jgi:hypothetical protein
MDGATVDDIKAVIDDAVAEAREKGMVGEGRFSIETVDDGFYTESWTTEITYHFERAENEKERAQREAAEAKRKVAKRKAAAEKRKLKKDAEYAEYRRLKAKFGDVE